MKVNCAHCGKELDRKPSKVKNCKTGLFFCNRECISSYSLCEKQYVFPESGWKIKNIVKSGEYEYVTVKEHPKANSCGYVLHHRIVAENKIGRFLENNEVVHHINKNKRDNRPENLQVMTNIDHDRLHSTIYKNGHFIELICRQCGKTFNRRYNNRPENRHNKNSFCSRECQYDYQRKK